MNTENLIVEKKEFILLKRFITLSSYHRAKTLLRHLKELSSNLETACVYSEDEIPKNVVRINSIVTVSTKRGGKKDFQLVLPSKENSSQNKISLLSCLGAAIIGKIEGSTITLDTPSNKKILRIEKVSQQNKNISLDILL